MSRPKILLACIKADFGQEGIDNYNDQGEFINPSWEWDNVYKPWKQLAGDGVVELKTYWTDRQNAESIDRLMSLSREVDFIYSVPVTHALGIHLPQAQKIIEYGTPIVSFHPDLHLRYKHRSGDDLVGSYIREGYTTHIITPAPHTMPMLLEDGVKAYCLPFGIPDHCQKQECDKEYDVTFVGQKHGIREQVVSQLRGAGIRVHTWGGFWPEHRDHHGRPSVHEMVSVFNHSKINLNLRWCSRDPNHGQIKGRDFELMGCGAFMIATQHKETDDFHTMYEPGKEFAEYHFVNDLVDGIKYYIEHDDERQAMADLAFQKREEHLWTTRLKKFLNDFDTLI